MKNHLLGIPLIAFLTASLQAAPDASPAPSPSSSPSPVAMKDFTYKELGMGFSMPGDPKMTTNTVKSAAGDITVTTYSFSKGEVAMMAMVTVFPKPISDSMKYLEKVRDGAVAASKARITSQKEITADNHPGLEFQFENAYYHGTYRLFAVGPRMYQLGSSAALRNPLLPGTDQFFASFHFVRP